jgi:hypothetical protein
MVPPHYESATANPQKPPGQCRISDTGNLPCTVLRTVREELKQRGLDHCAWRTDAKSSRCRAAIESGRDDVIDSTSGGPESRPRPGPFAAWRRYSIAAWLRGGSRGKSWYTVQYYPARIHGAHAEGRRCCREGFRAVGGAVQYCTCCTAVLGEVLIGARRETRLGARMLSASFEGSCLGREGVIRVPSLERRYYNVEHAWKWLYKQF